LYATPNLVEDFADKIETLLDDEAQRLRMGALGRQRVEKELNWDRSSERLIQAYERCLRHRGVVSVEAPTSFPAGSSRPLATVGREQLTDTTPTATGQG